MGCCLSARIKANESPLSSGAAETPARGGGGAGDTKIEILSTMNNNIPSPRTEGEILELSNLKSFTYQELRECTRNFQPHSLIGEGGFGCVYKGWVDEQTFAPAKPGTGLVIAVKRLNQDSFQGHQEWLAEIKYLSQLHHINLVKLIGYSLEDEHRLLVYEFMRRRSLEHLLFTRSANYDPLSWRLRMKIALGAARGLAFLHSQSIGVIYRDFKPANILIDLDYTAKLSDFGLAKDGPTNENQKSYVSTRVLGTHGYAAPEYIATGRLTTRSDVYSFGVVLLELLSGKRVFDSNRQRKEQDLVDWASPYLRSTNRKKFFSIMDTRIQGRYPHNGAARVGKLSLHCLSIDPRFRPTMKEVVAELEHLQLRDLNDD